MKKINYQSLTIVGGSGFIGKSIIDSFNGGILKKHYINMRTLNLKLILGITYLIIITIALYLLFSVIDIKDLTSYEFIRINKDLILKYKNDNFLFLTIIFFTFCLIYFPPKLSTKEPNLRIRASVLSV